MGQRNKTLRECPICHQHTMRRERCAKIDGKDVCDECYIDSFYRRNSE